MLLITVTRLYRAPGGGAARGTVTMTPARVLEAGTTVPPAPAPAALTVDGDLTLVVGVEPGGSPYWVVEQIVGAPTRGYPVLVPSDQGSIVELAGLEGAVAGAPAWVGPLRRISDATDYAIAAPRADRDGLFWDAAAELWTPGSPAASSLLLPRTAAVTPLSGHRLVVPTGLTSVGYADSQTPSHAAAPLWMTTQAAAAQAPVSVLARGLHTDSGWTWTPPEPLYLGSGGVLTHAVPAAPSFSRIVGWALSPTTIHFDPQPALILI